jgi:hypothetical protein
MNKRQQILSAATAITLFAIAAPATADELNEVRHRSEIKSCIAEVANNANYEDATRVRHMVVEKRRSRRGLVYTIDTSVFTDSDDLAAREYASYCIARGEDKLVKFTIDQVSG